MYLLSIQGILAEYKSINFLKNKTYWLQPFGTRYLVEEMKKRDNFQLVCKVQCCTAYKPKTVCLCLCKYNTCLYISIWCVFSNRGILWTFAFGSFRPAWEGRRTVRITRKDYQRSASVKCRCSREFHYCTLNYCMSFSMCTIRWRQSSKREW